MPNKNKSYDIVSPESGVKQNILAIEQHMERELKREKDRVRKKVIYALALLAAIYTIAVGAYHTLEGWSWEDSIFFTTSTITTVGYGDMVPHTYYGRLFTIPLMLVGVGVGFYVVYSIQDYGRTKLDSVTKHVDNISDVIARRRK
ncbi:MAG: potassium channel family protein [Candidatus Micrarchaeia archaeon]